MPQRGHGSNWNRFDLRGAVRIQGSKMLTMRPRARLAASSALSALRVQIPAVTACGEEPEMFIYCYRTFRVAARVDRLIDEGNRVFSELRNPCIVLESV